VLLLPSLLVLPLLPKLSLRARLHRAARTGSSIDDAPPHTMFYRPLTIHDPWINPWIQWINESGIASHRCAGRND
jgi:hypothetical protein